MKRVSGRESTNHIRFLLSGMGILIALLTLSGISREERTSSLTPLYEVYIGFSAKMECIPADGPYLTQLHYDLHIPKLRFNFRKRSLDGRVVNWFPYYGEGNNSSIPVAVFSAEGKIDAELCPHIKCSKEIKRAWFTKQDRIFQAVLAALSMDEIDDVRDELLEIEALKSLRDAVAPIVPCILHVKMLSRGKFAWTGECIVRGEDCGETRDLEFYLSLPFNDLLQGRPVTLEFPFHCDSIDAEGVLTVRFIPSGSIH